jgi:hypothetical protein
MTTWVLIFGFWAGALAPNDAVSLTSVTGFKSKESCEVAGKAAAAKFSTLKKATDYICVQQ